MMSASLGSARKKVSSAHRRETSEIGPGIDRFATFRAHESGWRILSWPAANAADAIARNNGRQSARVEEWNMRMKKP